jgi:3-methyladenine DNA glycosylase AlkD
MGDVAPAVLERLGEVYPRHRDRSRAPAMAAYMRDQFPFLGLPSPLRVSLDREVVAGLPAPAEADLVAVAAACWQLPEREYQYFAVGLLRRHVGRCSAGLLSHVEALLTAKSWWDTVDELARHVVGPLVLAHPQLRAAMDEWVGADNVWLARTAILHQERWKERTDPDVLFAYCARRAGDREFFLRKAIGWALRSYARVDPEAVRAFVAAHEAELSGLSRREALRHLPGACSPRRRAGAGVATSPNASRRSSAPRSPDTCSSSMRDRCTPTPTRTTRTMRRASPSWNVTRVPW